ncbi:hypothetical protein TWF730_006787 [Orbilia blumenaviensis]|uniref:Cyclin N-terminal domain-containing protein n=1 Tax=Orbilia blumenaviensis TaxID=1796055 RepID=A0AAV9VI86_9PEZI
MESKAQRKTRIFDENDPAVLAAAARMRKASTASTKSTANTRQRTSQTTRRVALVDSTRYETTAQATVTSHASNRTSKGSLNQQAARGKPLAAKSNASLATGAKSAQQQPAGKKTASASIKSTIYRDPQQQAQARESGKGSKSQQKLVGQAASGKERSDLVYRSSEAPGKTTSQVDDAAIPEENLKAAENKRLAAGSYDNYSIYGTSTENPSVGTGGAVRHEKREPENLGWEEEGDDIRRQKAVAMNFENRAVSPNFKPSDGLIYNPMRQLIKQKKGSQKWNYFPVSGWCSHEVDTHTLGFEDEKDEEVKEFIEFEEYKLWVGHERDYLVRMRRNGTGDRWRVYPQYTDYTDLEIVQAAKIVARNLDFKYLTGVDLFPGEYAPDIVRHTWAMDHKLQPDPHYMDTQPELEWHMRGILIDWLIEVSDRFQLDSETVFNTVNIIDRFLSVKVVPVDRLQLVGVAALLIASKYDEITAPTIDMLVYMSDRAFSGREIVSCEWEILVALEWEVSAPGPMTFLKCLSQADTNGEVKDLAQYFLESALTELRFVGTPWSYITACAYYLSMIILDVGQGEWSPAHIFYSGHCASQLAPGVQVLIEMMDTPEDHHRMVFTKYNRKQHRRIAGFVERWMVAQFAHSEEPAEGKAAALEEGREREKEIKIQGKMDRERRRRQREEADR